MGSSAGSENLSMYKHGFGQPALVFIYYYGNLATIRSGSTLRI